MKADRRPARTGGWIDVTVPVGDGMVHWPGDPAVRVERRLSIDRGDPCNVSALSLGSHTGTHVDAPLHYLAGGRALDQLSVDGGVGRARVVEIRDGRAITADELEPLHLRAGERVLFRTANSDRVWRRRSFTKSFVHLSVEAARVLATRKVRVVGVDYLSVGPYRGKSGPEVHRILLGAGILVIEGLDLSRAPAGPCDLICLPLKIGRGDGAPARVILRPILRTGR